MRMASSTVWFFGIIGLTAYAAAHAGDAGWYRVFVFLTALDLTLAVLMLCVVGLVAVLLAVVPTVKYKRVCKPKGTGFRRLVAVAYDVGMTAYMAYLGWHWLWVTWLAITVTCAVGSVLFYEVIGTRVFIDPAHEAELAAAEERLKTEKPSA